MHSFSNRAQIALVALVFLFEPIQGNNWKPCGDWIAYNNEKCFKIIDDTLRTFDEAKDVCATQEHTSTLAVIRSSEEQKFLSDYLFKTEQKVENFWIGARYSSQNGAFVWIDNSPLNYTNWDAGHSPWNLEKHCVQMQADMAVVGKWKDWRCVKKNAVVCQRMQFWSTEFLQKKFIHSRRLQIDSYYIIWNLTQSLESANEKISSQKERIDTLKQNLENVNQRVDELKQNYENAISNANAQINEQNQRFENAISNANAKINEQNQRFEMAISNANAQINEQNQNFEKAISNANAKINEQNPRFEMAISIANAQINKQNQRFENAISNANAKNNQQKQNFENVNQRIDELKQNFENAILNPNAKINEQKQNFENVNQRIDELKQNFENAISNANAKINEQKQNFESAISNANAKINEQKQNFIPIGFLYTQLHKEKAPADIWPWMTWTDVSSAYAGVFFRVEGGGSRQFGLVQTENTQPLITIIQTGECLPTDTNVIAGWSPFLYSGSASEQDHCLKFEMSDGEIRPKNVAIRVWRRTA